MALCGLWHGASWTFVLWGTLHGCALVVCSLWRRYGPRLPALLGWALTVMFVLLTGVIFRAGSLEAAWNILPGPRRSRRSLEQGTASRAALHRAAGRVPAAGQPGHHRAATRRPRPWLAARARRRPSDIADRTRRTATSMSSSTSSSDDEIRLEALPASPASARSASARCCCSRLMLLVDPYDSGAFGLLGIDGVDDRDTQYRERKPRARSAVRFRHHRQLDRAAAQPGRSVASDRPALRAALHHRAAAPREQLAVLDFFLRHHPRVGALVIVTDPFWCVHAPRGDAAAAVSHTGSMARARSPMPARLISRRLDRACIPAHPDRSRPAPAHDPPDGFFSYEDIWPPGQFRETNRPRDPAPVDAEADARRLSRNSAARRRDQKAAGRCCRRRGRAADSRYHRAQTRHALRRPNARRATPRWRRPSPAVRTATSSTIASTMR